MEALFSYLGVSDINLGTMVCGGRFYLRFMPFQLLFGLLLPFLLVIKATGSWVALAPVRGPKWPTLRFFSMACHALVWPVLLSLCALGPYELDRATGEVGDHVVGWNMMFGPKLLVSCERKFHFLEPISLSSGGTNECFAMSTIQADSYYSLRFKF
jgi:hypothetical protein